MANKIINKVEVASYALEYIKESASQDETSETENDDPSQIEDWLNAFVHRADDGFERGHKIHIRAHSFWEILSPGSFSVSTLRIITELDRKSASLFQSLCLSRLQDRHTKRQKC